MIHALRYEGGFERNHELLRSGGATYLTSDGAERPLPEWPADVDGLRIGYMEKPGKKFAAVRVQCGSAEVVLEHPVILEPSRHMGNRRFGPEPTTIADDAAAVLLADLIDRNRSQRTELLSLREQLRPTKKAQPSG